MAHNHMLTRLVPYCSLAASRRRSLITRVTLVLARFFFLYQRAQPMNQLCRPKPYTHAPPSCEAVQRGMGAETGPGCQETWTIPFGVKLHLSMPYQGGRLRLGFGALLSRLAPLALWLQLSSVSR